MNKQQQREAFSIQLKRKKSERYFWVKAQFFLVTFTLSSKNMVIQKSVEQNWIYTLNILLTQCKRVTNVGHFSGKNHCLHFTSTIHIRPTERLNFVIGRTNLQHKLCLSILFVHLTKPSIRIILYTSCGLRYCYYPRLRYRKFSVINSDSKHGRTRRMFRTRDWSVFKLTWAGRAHASTITLACFFEKQEGKHITKLDYSNLLSGDLKSPNTWQKDSNFRGAGRCRVSRLGAWKPVSGARVTGRIKMA